MLALLYRWAGRATPQRRRDQGARLEPVVLVRPRIFILPTRQGMLFALVLFTMLLGSINYNNSLGYVLTFLLVGVSFITILYTYRNLAHLEFSAGKVVPVFAGENALFTVIINNPSDRERHALILQLGQQRPVFTQVSPYTTTSAVLARPALRRGPLNMERLIVSTRFPLGLFCAWSRLILDARCLVYPAPRGTATLELLPAGTQGHYAHSAGDDDFSGQRSYRVGDSLARVNWKAVARGRGMLIKEFAGGEAGALWLDWERCQGLDDEARLSQLCQLVLAVDTAGQHFGLRLPDKQIGPAAGEAHKHACLAELALFRAPSRP